MNVALMTLLLLQMFSKNLVTKQVKEEDDFCGIEKLVLESPEVSREEDKQGKDSHLHLNRICKESHKSFMSVKKNVNRVLICL